MHLIDRLVEAEAVGDRAIRRIAKDGIAAADQYREIHDRKLETIQQILNAGIAIRVDEDVWVEISGQELLDAKRVGGMIRSDEHHISKPSCDQSRPAEKERPHEYLAQLRVSLYERQEIIALDFDHLARLANAKSHQRGATREHGNFAGELTRANGRYGRGFSVPARLNDLDGSRADDEKQRSHLSHGAEHFTTLDAARAAMRGNALDLRRRQFWKSLVDVRRKPRRSCRDRCRHDASLS